MADLKLSGKMPSDREIDDGSYENDKGIKAAFEKMGRDRV